jgi:hypothetical protein
VPRFGLLLLIAATGCVDPLTSHATNGPEWEVKNVKGYADTVAGLPPDVVYGWGLVVEGDLVRWWECSTVEVCGSIERERPKHDVLAVEKVGSTDAGDGGRVDVLKLSLSPAGKYSVPYVRPAAGAGK